jgi:LemA protein
MKRALFAAAAVLLAGCGYNRIQTLDEQANAFKSQIEVQLQRRADLVPNLVETVRGYAQQEQTIFIAVADARARLGGAVQSGSLQQMSEANQGLTGALGRLLAISENYPQLKSNENFRALQDQLEGTENRISTARGDYNTAVQTYNAYIRPRRGKCRRWISRLPRRRDSRQPTDCRAVARRRVASGYEGRARRARKRPRRGSAAGPFARPVDSHLTTTQRLATTLGTEYRLTALSA